MRYVLAIVLPPFALLGCGKPFQLVLNLSFWILSLVLLLFGIVLVFLLPVAFFVWVLCMLHAVITCGTRDRDRQMDRLVAAIEHRTETAPRL